MIVKGTYFQNDAEKPLMYGDVEIENVKRQRLKGEPVKDSVLCEPVMVGFCGTDNELMNMGARGEMGPKFPEGKNRLINGHEGIVWVPSENRFAIVLIRGGDSVDPTRYTEDETYFEYGCDKADGLFADKQYFNPDMLLKIPDGYVHDGKLDLSFAKKMVFPDPFACMLFQLERMEDMGSAHNFRRAMREHKCDEAKAREIAKEEIFKRTVIFGLGTTGMFIGDLISRKYPNSKILFVARSAEDSTKVKFALKNSHAEYLRNTYESEQELADAIVEKLGGRATTFIGVSGSNVEHRVAFEHRALGCNGLYNSFSLGPKISFDTMPFGFENHLIIASINFRQDHMEQAIEMLAKSNYDEIVELIDRDEFAEDPIRAYKEKIYSKSAPMKTAVIWNEKYVNRER
ncbi:Threonine dehydrogenase [Lachnospiraceae bacterium YSD2013]|nr:Threonine dehydrogenase [Lachnospiraceae bacterium YSD2013]